MTNLTIQNETIAGKIPAQAVKKDRQEYDRQRYQNKKEWYANWYRQRKQTKNQAQAEAQNNYSQAQDYKILMSLKEYTELNKIKKQNWLNFIWTFKDLNECGFHDIVQIMKIREEADKLIKDYWETAKNEVKRGKYWNDLSLSEQQKHIQYWGRQKANYENNLTAKLEAQAGRGQPFQKEISEFLEINKFHEERGRKNCGCWSCAILKKKSQLKVVECVE